MRRGLRPPFFFLSFDMDLDMAFDMALDMALDMEEYPKVEEYRLNLSVSAFPARAVQIRPGR